MKREYTIIIEARGAHQPSQDEIFKAVRDLIDSRVKEFPKTKASTRLSLTPKARVPRQRPSQD